MSRCRACDVNLTSFESTRKVVREDKSTEYVDLCNRCYRQSGLSEVANIAERYDLIHETDIDEEDFDNELSDKSFD